ncbi:hypothetical protein EVAR_55228_1 [Eumeta japonica]|uniref:Uncharacterized protein n=1 Tax=Eumeta variegata TaxID=151549 RepID=A0A4C1ZP88_EUMVA|nr:hypothetical protein EVAR_55228_1 [Eumeta japonica]
MRSYLALAVVLPRNYGNCGSYVEFFKPSLLKINEKVIETLPMGCATVACRMVTTHLLTSQQPRPTEVSDHGYVLGISELNIHPPTFRARPPQLGHARPTVSHLRRVFVTPRGLFFLYPERFRSNLAFIVISWFLFVICTRGSPYACARAPPARQPVRRIHDGEEGWTCEESL